MTDDEFKNITNDIKEINSSIIESFNVTGEN